MLITGLEKTARTLVRLAARLDHCLATIGYRLAGAEGEAARNFLNSLIEEFNHNSKTLKLPKFEGRGRHDATGGES